jgi:hypothetical protein
MRRHLLISGVLLLVTLALPRPASAGFWAWLEEWSGPGPFKGWTFLFTACVQDGSVKSSPIAMNDEFHREMIARAAWVTRHGSKLDFREALRRVLANPTLFGPRFVRAPLPPSSLSSSQTDESAETVRAVSALEDVRARYGPRHAEMRWICGYLDQGFFSADASPPDVDPQQRFPRLRAHMTDIGPSARLHDGIDLGGGLGWVTFSGSGVDKSQMTLTPVRLILRPILLAVPEHYRQPWMGVLNIYWKQTYVIGRLTGADFGAPQNAFHVDGEMIRSFGFNFDVTALFARRWKIPRL